MREDKRILCITPFPPVMSGASKASFEFIKRLKKYYSVFVITYQGNQKLSNIQVHGVWRKGWGGIGAGFMFIVLGLIRGLYISKKNNPKVIYAKNMASPGICATIIAILLRKRLIIHTSGTDVQNLEQDYSNKNYFTRTGFIYKKFLPKIFLWELRQADAIVANCYKDLLIVRKFGFTKKAVLIYNGVDHQKYQPNEEIRNEYRSKLNIHTTETCISYLGQSIKQKNIPLIIDLARNNNEKKFLLIGPNQSMFDFNKSHSNCIFTGPTKDVHKMLNAADVLIHPSSGEGLSNAVLEAMATELPVISFPVGDHEILIENGKNGFIVDSIDQMQLKINFLAENPEVAKKIGKEARRTILRNHDWNMATRKILKIFKLLNRKISK